MNCEWCGAEIDGKWIAVVEGKEFKVCADCLNLLGNHEYEKLTKRIEKRWGI